MGFFYAPAHDLDPWNRPQIVRYHRAMSSATIQSLVVSGGHVIDPANNVDLESGDVVVGPDGRVVEVGPTGSVVQPSDARTIDASGCVVTPGLIDPHVHLREPGGEDSETIESGSLAAVDGGFTSVCCMPNTKPALDRPEMIRFIFDRARETARCRVFPVGAVSVGRKGEALAEIALMQTAGAVAFSDDGDVVESAGLMHKALKFIARTGLPMMQHCQEPSLTVGSSMNAGATATRLGLTGWPRIAEEVIIERDIRLNTGINAKYHVQHMSSGASVELIRRARAAGQPVTAEASPHHLLLTDEACDGYNTMAKMNPPLREAHDVEALREGVADGTITILGTDHAPHPAERKALEFEDAPFGIVGLESALPLYVKALIEPGHIDWPRLIELMTINPARLCGLDAQGLGSLTPNTSPGDITIIDPNETWTIRATELAGKSSNTPFDGWTVTGRARMTIVGGRVVMTR